ncbi:ATP-dependent nuclease [Gimesia maris]|uniref:ATPase AAA-type core domain-containing protein n=1 Tax=Gimesia maris TaxID=122 RepID=A0ABX5YMH2_9PLAN|nr:AAA family ATPase [Gimesia maris]EDL56323.1 hypothetical protein PM8797T_30596 [Gimesia maris DSM 8797]QEG16869.1 hypothetical protein GmarT_27380 [Gimesia maris]QGQ29991.1 ATP-binding protein [Gimesia maris]
MIKSIKLKFGSAPESLPVEFDMAPVTIFVGPNNSGKSKILKEIRRFCSEGRSHPNDLILEHLTFDQNNTPDEIPEEQIHLLKNIIQQPRDHEHTIPGYIYVGDKSKRKHVDERKLFSAFSKPNIDSYTFCCFFLDFHTLLIDGNNRTNLIPDSCMHDPDGHSSIAQSLFYDDVRREELRNIIYKTFHKHFVIDATSIGHLKIRLSENAPNSNLEERGFHHEAVEFHKKATSITDYSDGVKAFTGILAQIIAGDPQVIIIDEPEAFLAPTLSFKLGKEVAFSTTTSNKRLFVSTHSANFVMGCIQSGVPINIVRLTYQNNIPTARTLPENELKRLIRNPLFRSTGVLEGLFYESVIVTEADSDRAFYQEINERLLQLTKDRGIPNCLFLNAQNKQTVHQIIKPLRELGIPAVGLVDIDILKNGGKEWTHFMKCGFIPEARYTGLGQNRADIYKLFKDTGKCMKRDGGIELLSDDNKEAARDFFKQLADYGLFAVESGELESWLKYLEVPKKGHGPSWLIDIFERMGEDPESPEYVKPDTNDVWEFMDQIAAWFKNPKRKGIPT